MHNDGSQGYAGIIEGREDDVSSTTVALLRICNPGSYIQPIMMAFVTQGLLSEPSMIRAEFTLLLSPPSFRIGLILADPTSPHFFQDWIATFARSRR